MKLVDISIKRGSIHDLLKLAWGNMQKMNLKNVLIKHKLLIKLTCWFLNLHIDFYRTHKFHKERVNKNNRKMKCFIFL